ncbi:hypothetical protein C2142_02950 [Streptomyces sp. CB01881]|nr:hypothetical protein C2142_02950 [Streptomyces sp. CB01881]
MARVLLLVWRMWLTTTSRKAKLLFFTVAPAPMLMLPGGGGGGTVRERETFCARAARKSGSAASAWARTSVRRAWADGSWGLSSTAVTASGPSGTDWSLERTRSVTSRPAAVPMPAAALPAAAEMIPTAVAARSSPSLIVPPRCRLAVHSDGGSANGRDL